MSYDVSNIIPITVRISPAGLAFANFGTAMLFASPAEVATETLPVDTFNIVTTAAEIEAIFPLATAPLTNGMANAWLGGIPASASLLIWNTDVADTSWPETLDKARNVQWWFWSLFTPDTLDDVTINGDVEDIALWANDNESMFVNCQVGTSSTAIRDPNVTTDIATALTSKGFRFVYTFSHASDPTAGVKLAKWFASVNYSAVASTITGEYKKLSGIAAEDLSGTETGAMKQDTKKAVFYSVVELQGSTDNGRVINSLTHSSFGEFIDDVVNLAAFVNSLKVALFNVVANNTTKLGQDPVGQSVLIGTSKSVCEQYIANNYLGPRNYLDPDDGIEKFTKGYEILTQPEDILDLSDSDRAERKSAPLRIRIFRKGAIHIVPVDIDVF